VRIAALLHDAGLHAPSIVADDLAQGFLLLTDLGHTTYLAALRATQGESEPSLAPRAAPSALTSAHELMTAAIAALVRWQSASRADVLPAYDGAFLQRELDLFREWYVARHLGHRLSPTQLARLHDSFGQIIASALAQPSVYVHRDFMPRN